MPNEKLTQLQQAVIEHDDDMARLDRNTMPTPETPITVESCLAELHAAYPKAWCYIEQFVTADAGPKGKLRIAESVEIQVETNDEIIYSKTYRQPLHKAMQKYRAWKAKQ